MPKIKLLAALAIAMAAPASAHDPATGNCEIIGLNTTPYTEDGYDYILFDGVTDCHNNNYRIVVTHAETGAYLGYVLGYLIQGGIWSSVYVQDRNLPFTYEISFY